MRYLAIVILAAAFLCASPVRAESIWLTLEQAQQILNEAKKHD